MATGAAQRALADATDGAVVAAHLSGRQEAFDVLYRRYHLRLVRICRSFAKRSDDAEDLAQETMLRALAAIDSFDCSRPMWPWLKTIATRLAMDLAAKRSSGEIPTILNHETAAVLSEDDGFTVETAQRDLVERALRGLNDRHEIALRMRYLEDWAPADVARFLGLTPNALDQLLHRARRRLCEEYTRLVKGAGALVIAPLAALVAGLRGRLERARTRLEAWSSAQSASVLGAFAGLEAIGGATTAAVVAAAAITVAGPGLTPAPQALPELAFGADRTSASTQHTQHAPSGLSPAEVGVSAAAETPRRRYLRRIATPIRDIAPVSARDLTGGPNPGQLGEDTEVIPALRGGDVPEAGLPVAVGCPDAIADPSCGAVDLEELGVPPVADDTREVGETVSARAAQPYI